jgi:hypothetical protein
LEKSTVNFGWCEAVWPPVGVVLRIQTTWVIKVAQGEPVYAVSDLGWKSLKERTLVLSIARLLE